MAEESTKMYIYIERYLYTYISIYINVSITCLSVLSNLSRHADIIDDEYFKIKFPDPDSIELLVLYTTE